MVMSDETITAECIGMTPFEATLFLKEKSRRLDCGLDLSPSAFLAALNYGTLEELQAETLANSARLDVAQAAEVPE